MTVGEILARPQCLMLKTLIHDSAYLIECAHSFLSSQEVHVAVH